MSEVCLRCPTCAASVVLPLRATEADQTCASCARIFPADDGILQVGDIAFDPDQPKDYYSLLFEAEPRHFWFTERNALIVSTLRKVLGEPRGRSALDVGCGTGFVTSALERAGMRTCGLDTQIEALRLARRRTAGLLLLAAGDRVDFNHQFDVVLLCDVIEHIEDDLNVLRQAGQSLQPGGALVVTVPAHRQLWTTLDDLSGHKRRYSRQELVDSMRSAGYSVSLAHYFNCLLMPAQWLQRQLLRRNPARTPAEQWRLVRDSLRPPAPPINTLLRAVTATDRLFSPLPIALGSSLIAVGQRA
jgi:2-polyprenyl-3-methyl-5-hydroxy-6-metoxy-1,4-benzoquinol methylase